MPAIFTHIYKLLPRLFPRKMRVGPLQNLPGSLCLTQTAKGTTQFQRQRQTDLIDCADRLIQRNHLVVACQNHIGAGERIASAHDIFAEARPFNTVSNRIAGKSCDVLESYRRRIHTIFDGSAHHRRECRRCHTRTGTALYLASGYFR